MVVMVMGENEEEMRRMRGEAELTSAAVFLSFLPRKTITNFFNFYFIQNNLHTKGKATCL